MAGYCHELDDVHRLLPSEILKDIGVIDAVVEDIADRLAGVVLGRNMKRAQFHLPAQATAASSYQHHPPPLPPQIVFSLVDSRGSFAGGNAQRPLPSNGRMLDLAFTTFPRFTPAPRPQLFDAAVLPAKPRSSGGTGVFLPRTKAYHSHRARASRPPRKTCNADEMGTHCNPKQKSWQRQRRQGEEEEARRTRRQLPLHAHAAGKLEQQAHKTSDASHAHACLELGLPQEWVY